MLRVVPAALRRVAFGSLAGCCALALGARGVSAQDTLFDWNDEKTVDSGKKHVKFSGAAKVGDIIVSFGDKHLYFITAQGEADVYPVATPRDQSRWEGATIVSQKRENPSWTPTAHMLSENPKLPLWVPGGHPMNPLGVRALYLGASDYRIHGTDAPWTIGTPVSKGCVRMFNKDVLDLYPRVKVGTKVFVTWEKFDGRTIALPQTKGIVELPAGVQPTQSHASVASYQPGNSVSHSRAVRGDDAEDVLPKVTPFADAGADAPSQRRKARSAVEADGAAQSNETPVVHKASAQQTASEQDGQNSEPTVRRRKPKSDVAAVETGSLRASSATKDASDSTPALSVAERALAAAERAAKAAERAADAADRAVAASQRQAVGVVSSPAALIELPTSTAATSTVESH